MSLNRKIEEFLIERGAIKVGFANKERLSSGPPSADLEYSLPGARSAVSFAVPFDRDKILAFLGKEDRVPHEQDNLETNYRVTEMAWDLSTYLKELGVEARGTAANLNYRKEEPNWQVTMPPKISHRYVAVAAGAASFGWSGNVGIKGYGAAIIIGTCLTTAELEPTELIPEEESFCDNCKLCVSACPVEMFEKDKEMTVSLGGMTFTHAARKTCMLCQICCGGFTGLHKSGKWSSWAPGRYTVVPEDEEKLLNELMRAMNQYEQRPKMTEGYKNPAFKDANLNTTCGNCQIICWGDKKETAKNLKLLQKSGCILQRPDGSLYAVPPEEAAMEFEKMDPERRKLYC